jgi:hypothetical protein
MATLSLPLPGGYLIDDAIGLFRPERTYRAPVRRKAARAPEPQSVRVPGIHREIVVKIASEPEEWQQAFELVAANYQERGYEAPTDKPYRFTPYHTLPDTIVFVAKHEGRVVATFSLVADNTLIGLPMEAIYGDEIAGLRREGRRMAEVTSLACTELGQREFLQVFTTLIKVLQQYHVSRGGDTWVIAVNPRHRSFYQKVLGFRSLGPCKAYSAVGDAPAEAYLLDRDLMRANAPRTYEYVFGEPLSPAVLSGVPLPRPFIRYFWEQSNQANESRLGDLLDTVATLGSPRAW